MDIRDWMLTTKASDLMVRDVLALSPDDTLADAADAFLREQISGAPIVEPSGKCVGVLSVSDVAVSEEKAEEAREELASSGLFHSSLALPMSVYEEELQQVRDKLGPAADQPIRRFMTSDVVSVRDDAALSVVVQYMIDAHVHRVVVLDGEQRLLGIISTTDVLAALLRASQRER